MDRISEVLAGRPRIDFLIGVIAVTFSVEEITSKLLGIFTSKDKVKVAASGYRQPFLGGVRAINQMVKSHIAGQYK